MGQAWLAEELGTCTMGHLCKGPGVGCSMACVWRPDAATVLGPEGPGIEFPDGGGWGWWGYGRVLFLPSCGSCSCLHCPPAQLARHLCGQCQQWPGPSQPDRCWGCVDSGACPHPLPGTWQPGRPAACLAPSLPLPPRSWQGPGLTSARKPSTAVKSRCQPRGLGGSQAGEGPGAAGSRPRNLSLEAESLATGRPQGHTLMEARVGQDCSVSQGAISSLPPAIRYRILATSQWLPVTSRAVQGSQESAIVGLSSKQTQSRVFSHLRT